LALALALALALVLALTLLALALLALALALLALALALALPLLLALIPSGARIGLWETSGVKSGATSFRTDFSCLRTRESFGTKADVRTPMGRRGERPGELGLEVVVGNRTGPIMEAHSNTVVTVSLRKEPGRGIAGMST
jgi:uncharacterized protein (DUF58 family)